MSARASIHAMFTLDAAAEQELDTRLDALVAEELRAAATDIDLRVQAGGPRARGLAYARALLRARADGAAPKQPRRSVKHQEVAKSLRATPGEWAPVGDYLGGRSANAIARLVHGKAGSVVAYLPAGSFEARTEVRGDRVWVYARYVGEAGGDRG